MNEPVDNMTIPILLVINLMEGRAQKGWTLMSHELISRRRSSVSYRRVIRFDANGTYWEARYGLTAVLGHVTDYRVCDGTLADVYSTYPSNHMLEIHPVKAENRTVLVYVPMSSEERRFDASTILPSPHLGSNLQDPPPS